MNSPTAEQLFHQGAKVRRPYLVEPSRVLEHVGTYPRTTTIDQAYELARANKHKPWARRWLRERRFL